MTASIVFVHGAGHGAWCWRDHFTGWFATRGYQVLTPDLPGHGDLDRGELKKIPLSRYIETVASIVASLDPPVILVGHSMGGFIIQKYLESAEATLAILLASTPPAGVLGMVRRMATRRPMTFLRTLVTGEATDSLKRTRDYFFSALTADPIVEAAHRRLQPESSQVLRDMMRRLHSERVNTPVLVMGAEDDWLVAPPSELAATARAFHTRPITLPAGHDMMLDVAWEQVALEIDRAITAQLAEPLTEAATGGG